MDPRLKAAKFVFKHSIRLLKKPAAQQGVIRVVRGRAIKESLRISRNKNLPHGPWPLKVQGGVDLQTKPLNQMLRKGGDLSKRLNTKSYQELSDKYKYIKNTELADNKELLKRLQTRELELATKQVKVGAMRDKRDAIAKLAPDHPDRLQMGARSGELRDMLKPAEKNLKTNTRQWKDLASSNLLEDDKYIYEMTRKSLKSELSEFFAESGEEWHHIFGNKEAGELFLNKTAQDPMITVNLMEHLKRLKLKTSGTRANLTKLAKDPHSNLHKKLRKMGFEQGKDLDFAEYMREISNSYQKGETSIDEFFTMLEVYANRTMPWLRKLAKKHGGVDLKDIPMDKIEDAYKTRFGKFSTK